MTVTEPTTTARRRGGHGRLRRGALRRRPGHHGADASSTSAACSGSTRPCAARPAPPPELAAAAGIDARYAREWLEQQAAAGVLTVDDATAAPDERRFTLPEEHAIVLLDEEHPAYTGALADVVGPIVRTFDQLVEAFRTGQGVAFSAYGLHDMQAGFTRPMFANEPGGRVAPAPPRHPGPPRGRRAPAHRRHRLRRGLGRHLPRRGLPARHRRRLRPRRHLHRPGPQARLRARRGRPGALRGAGRHRHQLRRPLRPRASPSRWCTTCPTRSTRWPPWSASRGPTAPCSSSTRTPPRPSTPDGDPIQRLLYGFSVLHCLPAGRTHEHSAATGTVMRPATFEGYATRPASRRSTSSPSSTTFFRFYSLGR